VELRSHVAEALTRDTLAGVPVQEAVPRLPAVAASMLQFCAANADGISEGLLVLPGVADLLAALAKRPNTVTGLVTGNLEAIGWAKMAALGLKQHFTTPLVGGFSSDYCSNQLEDHSIDRAEFIRVATRKAVASGRLSGPPRIVHFGDTPNDVKAAASAGAVPVGLATGAFTLDQLRATAAALGVQGTAVMLRDLKDTAAVLAALG
jgi:phosphoglycolate phosphatase